tara:strand:+ start:255 stop:524 length:270 start_codon:yes stop_codon:yes gene_type:complete
MREHLITAAQTATKIRQQFGVESKEYTEHRATEDYAKFITEIDALSNAWRAKEPRIFWVDSDPDYILMAREWRRLRDIRTAKRALALMR